MQKFFDEMKNIRDARTDDYSKFYSIAMTDDLFVKKSFIEELPMPSYPISTDSEIPIAHPLHQWFWCLNAWSRHCCFVLKDFSHAEGILDALGAESHRLFQFKFQMFDQEVKLFPLILALNATRISFYKNDLVLLAKQQRFLVRCVETAEWTATELFSVEISKLNESQWQIIKLGLSTTNKKFLLDKINNIGSSKIHGQF